MMRSAGIGWIAVLILSASLPATAGSIQLQAQKLPCGTRTEIIDILTKTYGEREVAHGLANTGALAEVFVGEKGTWTIVATSPNGTSCLIGAGHDWERSTTGKNVSTGGTGSYQEGI